MAIINQSGDVARFFMLTSPFAKDGDLAAAIAACTDDNELDKVTSAGAITDTQNFVQERIYGKPYPTQIATNKDAADVELKFIYDDTIPFQVTIMEGGTPVLAGLIVRYNGDKPTFKVMAGYYASPSTLHDQGATIMNTFMFMREDGVRSFVSP